jgi:hypothetical protein
MSVSDGLFVMRQSLRQEITVSRGGEIALAELNPLAKIRGEVRLPAQAGTLQR